MASQVTITGTVTDPSGTGLNNPTNSNAFVRFILRNFQGYTPLVSGTAIVAETQIDCIPGSNGAFSQNLWPQNALTPSNTFYSVQFFSQGRITSQGNYIFNASTSLNSAAQLNPAPTPTINSIVFENNGVPNSSQTLLNLENTDGSITITDEGSGAINITSNTGGGFSTAGQGAFFGPGIVNPYGATLQYSTLATSNNVVYVYQFTLSASWTIRNASFISENSGAGDYYGFGIYNAAGQALITTSFLSTSITAAAATNTFSAVTLPPGTYYFAQSVDSTGLNAPAFAFEFGGGSATVLLEIMNADSQPLASTAANTMGVGTGVMPATLGTLTPLTTSPNVAAVKWNP
jgi:hypothetical protein